MAPSGGLPEPWKRLGKKLAAQQSFALATATPALQTTEIFGKPIFVYGYCEAVVDGYLVDHEPPIQLITELSRHGIHWEVGEKVSVYDASQQQTRLFETPDEIHLDIDDFNRKVITESFNRVVCQRLAQELDPASRQKTLIFCVLDTHADSASQHN